MAMACALVCAAFAAHAGAGHGWRSLETPRYAVLSQLSDRDTRAWAAEFDVFIDAFNRVIDGRQAAPPPLTVVLFARRAAEGPACAVRQGTWGLSGTSSSHADALREGVRWLTRSAGGRPPWVETGLAEAFSTFDVHGGNVRWGKAMPDHLDVLRERGLVPLDELLDHRDAILAQDGDARRYTAQAWALTHVLFFGGEPDRRERFRAWLRHRGTHTGNASFRAAFHSDFDALRHDLDAYVEQGPTAAGLAPRGMVEHKYIVSAASPVQVSAALGVLEVAR
jgi:hypothetical protein